MSAPDFVCRLGDIDSLLAFFPGVAQPHREDIQDALLYAQQRAGHLYDFQSQWHSWIHAYRQHLEGLGFVPRGVVAGDSLVIGTVADLDRASFRIANPQVMQRLAELVRDSFTRLEVIEAAQAFFEGRGLSGVRLGSFQIMPCVSTANRDLSALLCSLRLNVDEYAASGRRLILHFKGAAYHFQPERFAPRREGVCTYLLGKSRAFITRVEL
ncbi:putative uncharacterized protein [Pseudomonas sp. StFLB209]|uniref:hypothetical protein n=1 Tax=Pseudomonas sp. StFLB209 TaxID=1028989 RepID=UPI0004F92D40|nr:hypothetical protein [Pseudomonas sp. StFLB209]BAP43121.1 putative uncharacterized protein [Pseudomonas sp. StFLB209]